MATESKIANIKRGMKESEDRKIASERMRKVMLERGVPMAVGLAMFFIGGYFYYFYR